MLPKIEYGVDVIVGVRYGAEWRWYVSDKYYWFLDLVKMRDASRAHGYVTDGVTGFADRFGIAIVTEDTAELFLAAMEPHRVDKAMLRALLESRLPIKSWEDVIDVLPSLLVDFDSKRLLSSFPEPASFEYYVPQGWNGAYIDFLAEVPEDQRYWIINGHDYSKDAIPPLPD